MNYITKLLMPALLVSLLFAGSMSAGSIEVVNKMSIALELSLGEGRNSIPILVLASDVTRIPDADVDSIRIGKASSYKTSNPIKINNKVDSKYRVTVFQDTSIQIEELVD